jgi:hypothetical protein
MQCLSPPSHDLLGRPVVLIKLSNVQGTAADIKQHILSRFERLRLSLVSLNAESNSEDPILQYIVIVDLANAGGMSLVNVLN